MKADITAWLNFISTLVWQIIVVAVLWYFRGEFANLFKNIIKVKGKGFEISFQRLSPEVTSKQPITTAIGALGQSDLGKIQEAIKKLDPKVTAADSLKSAKEQLQGYVREARTPKRIAEITKVFKELGIPLN
jgi:hypothetical protein